MTRHDCNILLFLILFFGHVSLGFISFHPVPTTTLQHQQVRQHISRHQVVKIDGLLDNYEQLDKIDSSLQLLQEQLPRTLVQSLTTESASKLYASDFVLVGPNDEQLVADRDELVSLSNAIVTATVTARQADILARQALLGSSADNRVGEIKNDNDSSPPKGLLECIIRYRPGNDNDKDDIIIGVVPVNVTWKTTLFTAGSILQGQSRLELNSQSGLVQRHKLLEMRLNDQEIQRVGETLATLRRTFRSVQDSPWLKNGPLAASLSVFDGIRQEFVQQAATTTTTNTKSSLAKLIITTTSGNNSTNGAFPSPGLPLWKQYASSHEIITQFCQVGLPVLSSGGPRETLEGLFSEDCEYVTVDNVVLSSSGTTIAKFYKTLASIRMGTFGDWKATNVRADWKRFSVTVDYTLTTGAINVVGRDKFTLSSSSGLVKQIKQMKLVVGGSVIQDGELYRRFFTGVLAGSDTVVANGDFWLDFFTNNNNARPTTTMTKPGPVVPPKLSKEAAASVYNILATLHADLQSIATLTTPPANEFITKSIQLKGYLGEVLLQGDGPYQNAMNVILTSFRTSLRTNRLVLESNPPQTNVELLVNGDIMAKLKLKLRIKLPLMDATEEGGGVPLTYEIKSKYKTNVEGKIVQHEIIETRINGQLTPADVVTKALKQGGDNNDEWWRSDAWKSLFGLA